MRENNVQPYWLLTFEAMIFSLGFLEFRSMPGVGLVEREVSVGSCGPKWEIKPDEWVWQGGAATILASKEVDPTFICFT